MSHGQIVVGTGIRLSAHLLSAQEQLPRTLQRFGKTPGCKVLLNAVPDRFKTGMIPIVTQRLRCHVAHLPDTLQQSRFAERSQ